MNFVNGLDADGISDLPAWPGQPVTALWDYPAITKTKHSGRGTEVGVAVVQTLLSLRRRIELMISLDARRRQHSDLQQNLRDMTHL
jgi:hypothetical protein